MYRLILAIIITLLSTSCQEQGKQEHEGSADKNYIVQETAHFDGIYCANVQYHNPNTDKKSSYTLRVTCTNDKLTSIQWPDGGEMDTDHFVAPSINSDSTCHFSSDKNYQYEVRIIGNQEACTELFNRPLQQCTGKTKSGERCKRMTTDEDGRCWQHKDD